MSFFRVGDSVERTKPKWMPGEEHAINEQGKVFAVETGRVQVQWEGNPGLAESGFNYYKPKKTWLKPISLKLVKTVRPSSQT